jgi:hypothetical protein
VTDGGSPVLEMVIALRDAFLAVLLGMAGVDYAHAPHPAEAERDRDIFQVAIGPEGDGLTIAFLPAENEERFAPRAVPAPRLPRLRLVP